MIEWIIESKLKNKPKNKHRLPIKKTKKKKENKQPCIVAPAPWFVVPLTLV
jgi:hypothetical protein